MEPTLSFIAILLDARGRKSSALQRLEHLRDGGRGVDND